MSDANCPVGYLRSLRARDVMRGEVVWVDPEDSVQATLATMDRCGADYVLLRRAEKLDAIVSRSDLLGAVSPYLRPQFCQYRRLADDASLQIKIKWIASRPVWTTRPETPLALVMDKMCRFGGKCLPVVGDGDKVQGLMLVSEILKAICPAEALPSARRGAKRNDEDRLPMTCRPESKAGGEAGTGRQNDEDDVSKESPMNQDEISDLSRQPQADIQGHLNKLEQGLGEKLLALASGQSEILKKIIEPTELKSTVERQEADIQGLRQELENKNAEFESLREARGAEQERLQSALEERTRELTRVQETHARQMERQAEELARVQENLAEQTAEGEDLRSQLEADKAQWQTARDALERQMKDLEEAKERLEGEQETLAQDLRLQKEALAAAQATLEQKVDECDRLRAELGDSRDEIERVQQQLEAKRAQSQALEEDLRAERERATQQSEAHEKELAESRDTLLQKRAELAELSASVEGVNAQLQALEAQLEERQQALEVLKREHRAEIDDVNETLALQGEELGSIKAALAQKAGECEGLRSQLDAGAEDLQAAQAELQEHTVRSEQIQKELLAGRNKVEDLITQFQEQLISMTDTFVEER